MSEGGNEQHLRLAVSSCGLTRSMKHPQRCPLQEGPWQCLSKCTMHLPFSLAIPILEVYRTYMHACAKTYVQECLSQQYVKEQKTREWMSNYRELGK